MATSQVPPTPPACKPEKMKGNVHAMKERRDSFELKTVIGEIVVY